MLREIVRLGFQIDSRGLRKHFVALEWREKRSIDLSTYLVLLLNFAFRDFDEAGFSSPINRSIYHAKVWASCRVETVGNLTFDPKKRMRSARKIYFEDHCVLSNNSC
jgi:hypothetical protein